MYAVKSNSCDDSERNELPAAESDTIFTQITLTDGHTHACMLMWDIITIAL